MDMQPIYVLDTNILIDYVDIIPNGEDDDSIPKNPNIDLSSAHIVIPDTVFTFELGKMRKEKFSNRGYSARIVGNRLHQLWEAKSNDSNILDCYGMAKSASVKHGDQTFSILPVNPDFYKALPFRPAKDDMDGQIILTAFAASLAAQGCPVDGKPIDWGKFKNDNVVLLTNDTTMATRASNLGIKTSRYGYQLPKPYTGRRDLKVPDKLFAEFFNTGFIDHETWAQAMPNEQPLIANEFIIMSAENYPKDFDFRDDRYFYIGRYDKEENRIVRLAHAKNFPCPLKTAGQAIYAEALMNKNISAVLCTGPAGTGKTFLSTVYSYDAVMQGQYIGISVVPCDTKDTVGFLPGDLSEKMDPRIQPIKNALKNYLMETDKDIKKRLDNFRKFGAVDAGKKVRDDDSDGEPKSIKEYVQNKTDLKYKNWFGDPIPLENARGRDFKDEIAIYDEFQDHNFNQADTLIKRLGDDGKIIITGDIEQIHSPYLDQDNNGIVYASRLLMDLPSVARVSFIESEVVRHPLVKEIARRQKENKSST